MTRRDHYSYAHYADTTVAEGFDALRFGGPIGRLLLETQERLLRDALAPATGHVIADVGTGTGRAAIGLAAAGAHVIGLDYSDEMLGVARGRAETTAPIVWARADAHALPLATGSVAAAVSLRVLMHAIDWTQCVAELCRIARWRVVVDFPSARSLAAIESRVRRRRLAAGHKVEAYRVMRERDVAREFARHGFTIVECHRQFVLPIAFHKAVNRAGLTRVVERGLAAVGLQRAFGSPITIVAEAASGRRTGPARADGAGDRR